MATIFSLSPLPPPDSSDLHPVFVYGTLKAGQSNHACLSGAVFHGRSRLIGAHLHDLGPYPMAVLMPDSQAVLHGELYSVDAAGLARLDRLEDYPAEYDRSRLRLSDGSEAWIYHGRPEQVAGAPRLRLGDWATLPVLHYGSNLDPARLTRRCPDWDGQGLVVALEGWSWAIDKRSLSGSGCAGIRPAAEQITWGVVTHLSPAAIASLDECEGVGGGHYEKTRVHVHSRCGARFEVLTYVPGETFRRAGLRPSTKYRQCICNGLAHWDLPASWRSSVEASLSATL